MKLRERKICLCTFLMPNINTGITTLPSNTQLTIDVWTKPTSTTQQKTLVSKWGSSAQFNFCFLLFLNWFAQGNIYFLVGNSAGNDYSLHSIAHNLSTSVYSNFTIVYDNGLISWYRNGVFVSPSVTSANTVLKTVTTAITIAVVILMIVMIIILIAPPAGSSIQL